MESLSFFDLVWRVVLTSAFAITPGILFWMLVLGLISTVRRLGWGRRMSAPASEATRT